MSWRSTKDGKHFKIRPRSSGTHVRMSQKGSSMEGMGRSTRTEPKLLAYGSVNVYEIDGKAYYGSHGKYTRAPERDYLIKDKEHHDYKVEWQKNGSYQSFDTKNPKTAYGKVVELREEKGRDDSIGTIAVRQDGEWVDPDRLRRASS